jgi:hypothetical protein
MIALVVSPWEKLTLGKRKRSEPTKTNMESGERSMLADPVPFIRSVPLINHT